MPQTFVLITGGNRGLGKGLVERFLAQPSHTVIAANRDPAHPTSKSLADLPKGEDSNLITLKYDAAVEKDAFDIVKELGEKHGVTYLDIVIPNAGISQGADAVKDAKRANIQAHVEVNVYGVVSLYQATRDLLQKSPREPIYMPISSISSFLSGQPPVKNACYGASKAMVNWFAIKIHTEDEWLNTFVMNPGFASTDMGVNAATAWGFPLESLTDPKEVIDGMFRVLQTSTKKEHGGKLVLYTGEVEGW